LAVNRCGDMAIGYTKMSSSTFPSVYYTGRLATDAPGSLQAETLLKAGEIAYTSFETSAPRRWGDYTEMTISPDGNTFWYLGEYSKNTGTADGRWGTYIGSFSFSACSGGGGGDPTPTPEPIAMRVSDLDGSGIYTNGGRRWEARVDIIVVDASGTPLSGVAVTGNWGSGATGSGTCTTGTNGICRVSKGSLRTSELDVSFSVTGLARSGYTYNASANSDPDGDSNGTTIIVNRP
jgi:hypothetical protein